MDALTPSSEAVVELERPLSRLHFGFMLLLVGALMILVVILMFPVLPLEAYNLVMSPGLTGALVKINLFCFSIGVYLSVRQIFLYYIMMSDLIRVEAQRNLIKPEHFRSKDLLKIFNDFGRFRGRSDGSSEASREYTKIIVSKSNGTFKVLNFIASILPMLGLLGTISGLVISVQGLANVGSESMDILASLRVIMGGMGVDFYTTIAGLILMIILRFINTVTMQMRQVLFCDIYEFLRNLD